MVISLELYVINEGNKKFTRAMAWIRLLKLWGSLRSDDLRGIIPDSMVLLKLRKAEEGEEWGSLDDGAKLAAKRKEEKLAANKGKSTQELLAEMYADADEDGKASLAAAWEAGRSKREGKGGAAASD